MKPLVLFGSLLTLLFTYEPAEAGEVKIRAHKWSHTMKIRGPVIADVKLKCCGKNVAKIRLWRHNKRGEHLAEVRVKRNYVGVKVPLHHIVKPSKVGKPQRGNPLALPPELRRN